MQDLRPPLESPADEFDRTLRARRDAASRQVHRLVAWWLAAQVVALTELWIALIYRDRFDADAVVTVALVWSVSLPLAVAVIAATGRHWSVLPRWSIAAGLSAWGVMLVEVTVAAAIWRLVV